MVVPPRDSNDTAVMVDSAKRRRKESAEFECGAVKWPYRAVPPRSSGALWSQTASYSRTVT